MNPVPVPDLEGLVLTADRSERTAELPFEKSEAVNRILRLVGSDADVHTLGVLRHFAAKLPMASLAKVRESLETQSPRNRAAYAVGALKSELRERAA